VTSSSTLTMMVGEIIDFMPAQCFFKYSVYYHDCHHYAISNVLQRAATYFISTEERRPTALYEFNILLTVLKQKSAFVLTDEVLYSAAAATVRCYLNG